MEAQLPSGSLAPTRKTSQMNKKTVPLVSNGIGEGGCGTSCTDDDAVVSPAADQGAGVGDVHAGAIGPLAASAAGRSTQQATTSKARKTGGAKRPTKAKEGLTWKGKSGKPRLCTPCGDKHEWKQWTEYVKHCNKFRCEREGCGYFKKCWAACEDIDCPGCHVPAHKRW